MWLQGNAAGAETAQCKARVYSVQPRTLSYLTQRDFSSSKQDVRKKNASPSGGPEPPRCLGRYMPCTVLSRIDSKQSILVIIVHIDLWCMVYTWYMAYWCGAGHAEG